MGMYGSRGGLSLAVPVRSGSTARDSVHQLDAKRLLPNSGDLDRLADSMDNDFNLSPSVGNHLPSLLEQDIDSD
jgi:hypothetical protein